jgi:hypothetical protein
MPLNVKTHAEEKFPSGPFYKFYDEDGDLWTISLDKKFKMITKKNGYSMIKYLSNNGEISTFEVKSFPEGFCIRGIKETRWKCTYYEEESYE